VGAARGREKGEGGKEGRGGRGKVVGETTEGVLSDRNSKVLLDWDGIQFPQRLRLILTEDRRLRSPTTAGRLQPKPRLQRFQPILPRARRQCLRSSKSGDDGGARLPRRNEAKAAVNGIGIGLWEVCHGETLQVSHPQVGRGATCAVGAWTSCAGAAGQTRSVGGVDVADAVLGVDVEEAGWQRYASLARAVAVGGPREITHHAVCVGASAEELRSAAEDDRCHSLPVLWS